MRDNNIIQEAIDCLKRLHKENAELKADNERLRQELTTYGATGICEVCSDKANKLADKYLGCLQEIKEIAEELLEKGLEPQSVEHQLRLRGKRELANIILQVITKAEREE